METRSYSLEETNLLNEIAEKLQKAGLNPFDTISAPFLYQLIIYSESNKFMDLEIHVETLKMLTEAFSRKEGKFHRESIQNIIKNRI